MKLLNQNKKDQEIYHSRRGRPVNKIDYYRSHHGTAARPISDPKTWSEVINSKEAKYWEQAANEEYRSLKDTDTINIIKHSQHPKGRQLMRGK